MNWKWIARAVVLVIIVSLGKIYSGPILLFPASKFVDGATAAVTLAKQGLDECEDFNGATCASISSTIWSDERTGIQISQFKVAEGLYTLKAPVFRINAAVCIDTSQAKVYWEGPVGDNGELAADTMVDMLRQQGALVCTVYEEIGANTFTTHAYHGGTRGPISEDKETPATKTLFGQKGEFSLRPMRAQTQTSVPQNLAMPAAEESPVGVCEGVFIRASLPADENGNEDHTCYPGLNPGDPQICVDPTPAGYKIEPSQIWVNKKTGEQLTVCEHGGSCYPRSAIRLNAACDKHKELLQYDHMTAEMADELARRYEAN